MKSKRMLLLLGYTKVVNAINNEYVKLKTECFDWDYFEANAIIFKDVDCVI